MTQIGYTTRVDYQSKFTVMKSPRRNLIWLWRCSALLTFGRSLVCMNVSKSLLSMRRISSTRTGLKIVSRTISKFVRCQLRFVVYEHAKPAEANELLRACEEFEEKNRDIIDGVPWNVDDWILNMLLLAWSHHLPNIAWLLALNVLFSLNIEKSVTLEALRSPPLLSLAIVILESIAHQIWVADYNSHFTGSLSSFRERSPPVLNDTGLVPNHRFVPPSFHNAHT